MGNVERGVDKCERESGGSLGLQSGEGLRKVVTDRVGWRERGAQEANAAGRSSGLWSRETIDRKPRRENWQDLDRVRETAWGSVPRPGGPKKRTREF